MTTDRDLAENPKYPHVVRFVRETPWAILESKLQEIRDIVALRASGVEFTREEIEARIGAGPARRSAYVTDGSVAVIPVYGTIIPRADMFSSMSGGTSIQSLQAALREAAADPKIKGILLDIDSPGGSVDMVSELAAEIRGVRKTKPVLAVANTMAASAAYWLGSQASAFSVTPSGSVGSIGVIAMHDDVTAMQEKLGVKTTMITAGKFKGELSPYAPLSEEATAAAQDRVNKFYGMFVQDVAYGRGVSVSAVRADYGEGRMLLAKDALAAGMVDQVETYDQALARLAGGDVSKGSPMRAEGDDVVITLDGAAIARATRAEADDPPGDPPDDDTDQDSPEAAASGLSFAQQAEALHASAVALLDRTTSLAEVERGHLTVSKRDRLSACTEALRETVTAIDGVLTATNPTKHVAGLMRERLRFERGRANL